MKHNFNAGPAILPEYTIQKSIEAIQDFNGSGLSLLCISHRSKDFDKVMDDAIAMTKKLLDIRFFSSAAALRRNSTTSRSTSLERKPPI